MLFKSSLFALLSAFLLSCQSDSGNVNLQTLNNANNYLAVVDPNKAPTDFDGTLNLTANLDNEYFFAGANPNEVYLLVNVIGARDESQSKRTPLNISVVVDRSGSMASEDKLKYAKKACNLIVENMASTDKLSVVSYDDYVGIVQPSGLLKSKTALKSKVDRLEPGGSTNLSGGMLEGYDQVRSTLSNKNVNRVLLLSDGLANRGVTKVSELQDIVRSKYQEEGIAISTFGVGANYDEDLLTNLAEYGMGNYYYISSADQIPELLTEELEGLLSVVAQNTKISIDFESDYLKPTKVYGYEHQLKGNTLTIDYNDVFSEEEKSVLIKFEVLRQPKSDIAFSIDLTYDDVLAEYQRVRRNEEKVLKLTSDEQKYDQAFIDEVKRNIVLFEATERFEQAAIEVDKGNYDQARKIIKDNVDFMDQSFQDVQPDSMLLKQYTINRSYHLEISEIETKSAEEISSMQKSNKSRNYLLRKKKLK